MKKIAYKGFDENLKCRNMQFEVGNLYGLPDIPNPRLCSGDGFHYCNELSDVFSYYNPLKGSRYCEIEILGNFNDGNDKSVTTAFRIIRELSKKEIEDAQSAKSMHIPLLNKIIKVYPHVIVGGSVALYLHGAKLDRWKKCESDLDLIIPYWTKFETNEYFNVSPTNNKSSGNDFDEKWIINGVSTDIKINPKHKYEVINYNGIRYKVSPLEVIIEAKCRYAMQGGEKHKDDLIELIIR